MIANVTSVMQMSDKEFREYLALIHLPPEKREAFVADIKHALEPMRSVTTKKKEPSIEWMEEG